MEVIIGFDVSSNTIGSDSINVIGKCREFRLIRTQLLTKGGKICFGYSLKWVQVLAVDQPTICPVIYFDISTKFIFR